MCDNPSERAAAHAAAPASAPASRRRSRDSGRRSFSLRENSSSETACTEAISSRSWLVSGKSCVASSGLRSNSSRNWRSVSARPIILCIASCAIAKLLSQWSVSP